MTQEIARVAPPPAPELIEAYPYRPEADSFDFRQSLRMVKHACRSHRLLIAMTTVVTIAVVALYIVLWPPIFVAELRLVGESDKDATRAGFYQNWAVFRKDHLMDEVHMVTAAPVLNEVIQKLGLKYDDVYHPLLSHAGYLWTESWPGRTYKKVKNWFFPPKRGPYDPTPEQVEAARTLTDFKKGMQLDSVADTNIGKLAVMGPTPRVGEIANTIVQTYLVQRRQRHIQEADAAYRALEAEMTKAEQELAAAEQRMQRYHSENGLLLTFEKDKIEIGHWQTLKAGITDLQASIAGQERALAEVDALLAREQKEIVSARVIQVNPIQDGLRDKLSTLELSRKQTLMHYRPDAPEIRELDRQIAIVKEQQGREPRDNVRQTTVALSTSYEGLRNRKAQLEAELAGQRATLASRTEAAERLRTEVETIPGKMRMVHELDREHKALEKKYSELRDKVMVALVSRASAQSAPPSIRIIEEATAPGEANWPKTKLLLLIAAAVGVAAGVALAVMVDLIQTRVHRHRLAEADWEWGPVYAIVGQDRSFAAQLFPPPAAANGGDGRGAARLIGS